MLIAVLVLVPHGELFCACFKLSRQVAWGLVHLWPCSIREHLNIKLDAINRIPTDASVKVLLNVTTQSNIF